MALTKEEHHYYAVTLRGLVATRKYAKSRIVAVPSSLTCANMCSTSEILIFTVGLLDHNYIDAFTTVGKCQVSYIVMRQSL